MNDIPLSARIPDDLHRRLRIYCAESHLRLREVVIAAIVEYLDRKNA